MDPYEIDVDACRGRQRRLLAVMHETDLPLAILTQTEHVQWLTGARFGWMFQAAVALSADGTLTLIAPQQPQQPLAADRITVYEAAWHATLRNDQRRAAMEALAASLAAPLPRRIGVEFSTFGRHLDTGRTELADLEPDLYRLRRRKDRDELARIQKAIAATEKMYARAREIVRPGVTELVVFNELQAAAVEEFGEMATGTGNDYQCASRGGPPRPRAAEEGELYILDLGPSFRGYFADNCRTLAVTQASDLQLEAWGYLMRVFEHVERTARPGKSARELFDEAQAILDEAPLGVFDHHLGHGVGLFPHEAPHLNPQWDDYLEVGDVFTVEPGLYAAELQAGLRIENNYRVEEDAVRRLTDFALEL
jgi:Xaa-Pro aminopeptidase